MLKPWGRRHWGTLPALRKMGFGKTAMDLCEIGHRTESRELIIRPRVSELQKQA